MSHILSPEQLLAVNTINDSEYSDIKYFDLQSAYQAVAQSILTQISQNKTVLIHLPEADTSLISVLHNLSIEGLDELSIDISSKKTIKESEIIKLRTILKKKIDTKSIIEFTKSNIEVEKQIQHINKYYEALDQKVMSDITFRDFSNSLIYNQSTPYQISTLSGKNQLEFTAQEFYSLKKEIKEASHYYKREFELLDKVPLLDDLVWSLNKDDFAATVDTITALFNKGSLLNQKFKAAYDQLIHNASAHVNQQQLNLELELNRAEEEFIIFNINQKYNVQNQASGISFFGKKKKETSNAPFVKAFDKISEIIEQLSKDWYTSLDAPATESINFEYISHFIKSVRKEKEKFVASIKNSILNSIQRINRINTDSNEIKALDSELNKLILEINESTIYSNSITNNAISFVKQVEFIEELCQYLDQCQILIGNHSQFGTWKQFQNQCSPIATKLIDQYKRTPVDQWETNMENWYFNQIKTQILGEFTIDSNTTRALYDSITTRNKNEVKMLCNILQNQRISISEQLKVKSKEVYNMLFKKKSISSSWNDLLLMNKEFLLNYFPIHISSQLKNLSDYDKVISFSRRPEIMENNSPIHYLSPIDSMDIDNRLESNDIFLYLNSYSYSQKIADLTSTEKLKASKKLAKYLLSLNQNIKIYQTKASNIISTLPLYDDTELESILEKYGCKTIDTNGVLYDRLTESILITARQPILIIKDELINPELHKNAIWQIYVQQLFKSAGFKVLSINTADQLKNNTKVFDQLIQKLNPGERLPQIEEPSAKMNVSI